MNAVCFQRHMYMGYTDRAYVLPCHHVISSDGLHWIRLLCGALIIHITKIEICLQALNFK